MTRRQRALAVAAGSGLLPAALLGVWILTPLPASLTVRDAAPGIVLEDRTGIELRATRGSDGSRRAWTPLEAIDPDIIAAFIAAEDRRFFKHGGVDFTAIGRAALANARAGRVVSGASTISMQLARSLHRTPRGLAGKVRQVLWAVRLERHLGKPEILEQYLNRVPLGQGTVGVDAAAALYFGASAGDVSLGQAALLAGLARAPSRGNPLVNPGRAVQRRNRVLGRLEQTGYAGAGSSARARMELPLEPRRAAAFLAPHFTTRLLAWAGDEDRSGARWRTSLDLGLQQEIEAEVRHTVEQLHPQGARHAAAVVLDNRTGGILAWVGSPDFWADSAGQVDMVVSPRQPGSALKPFVYGLAFDRGFTPASILADVSRIYQTSSGPYSPRNYDRRFHGPVRAREALGSSYNVPAVELANALGPGSVLATLHRAGFTSLARGAEHYGLGLALGNGDVTLLELANAYRALANAGVWSPVQWHATASSPGATRVMSAEAAALVTDILSDASARAPGFGLDSPLNFSFPVAAKTGTSRHFTDNWAVGVTGRFTVGVWVGNFSGKPMDGVSGVTGAGPLLHRAVLATAARFPPGSLPSPADAGAQPARICRLSGLRAGAACPGTTEWFADGTGPAHQCDWHRDGGVVLPDAFAEWAAATRLGEVPQPLVRRGPADSTRGGGPLQIVSPREGDRYATPPGVAARYATLALRATGEGAAAVRWFVDGTPISGARWALAAGRHVVRAEGPPGSRHQVTIYVD